MTTTRTGGCQCGEIRYEIAGEPRRLLACHCKDCQRQSGSAFGMTLVVGESDFRILEGKVKTFSAQSDAGREKIGAFCPSCGTRIYHKLEWRPGAITIKPGTLDDTSWLEPKMHIWTRSKQPWVVIPEGAQIHEKQDG